MAAYYNENEPFAAAWLRELIKEGLIANGEVDERSIEEVEPEDLRGFTQCHFFAGIGVWSYALRNAGWSDDIAVWTGSCPCQGFSASGKRGGFSDKRHLWPAWFRLIRECRPNAIFGEQVASQDGLAWFDVVSADMEGEGYTIGAADMCAAGVGAPHIRQRLYFVADTENADRRRTGSKDNRRRRSAKVGGPGIVGELADASESRYARSQDRRANNRHASEGLRGFKPERSGEVGTVAYSDIVESSDGELQRGRRLVQPAENPLTGFWRNAEWIYCRDEKYRAVEPGTFPLAHGATARVGRLRGYGNAINAKVAQAFIEAYLES